MYYKNCTSIDYCFINQYTGPLFIDILNVFAANGKDVVLITGSIHRGSASIDKRINVRRFFKYDKTNMVTRITSWLIFFLGTCAYLFFGNKKVPLILVSNPPIAPFIGLLFNKLFGTRYFVLIYDLYPDILVSTKLIRKRSIINTVWQKANVKLFSNAEAIFTIGDLLARSIRFYSKEEKSLIIISNWADTTFIKPLNKTGNWFAKKQDQIGRFTVLYSGNLGQTHDVETIMDVAAILKQDNHICFMIIGDGMKKKYIQKRVREEELNNVLLLDFQDPEVLPYSLTCADLSIVTLCADIAHYSIPSKLYYILAAGSPILGIVSVSSEVADIIKSNNCGEVFEPGEAEKISDFIKRLSRDSSLRLMYSNNAQRSASRYTPKNAEIYYEKITGERLSSY